ncbi:MAG: aldo/keto reductase [Fusicatenibacter sp.]
MNFILSNGIQMPAVGIGTFLMTPEQAEEAVYTALTNGYRMVDTANAYMNERAVGRGIRKSGVPRQDIFLSTKIWASEYEKETAVEKTLEILNVNYIDLLYIHISRLSAKDTNAS